MIDLRCCKPESRLYSGDALEVLKTLEAESVQTCVTSPPYYGLRDYGVDGQIGLEETPDAYIARLVDVFREVRRTLRKDGTLWLNLGDSYASGGGASQPHRDSHGGLGGSNGQRTQDHAVAGGGFNRPKSTGNSLKPKDLLGIPWRVAFALQADGWFLRQDIIWHKPNPMPESVRDRCTKAHEYLFLLSKSARYFYDADAVKEPSVSAGQSRGGGKKYSERGSADRALGGAHNLHLYGATPELRNRRSVWTIATKPCKEAHFAVMPDALVEPCILAGSSEGDTVLDPFAGAGTTGRVAVRHRRSFVGIELNPDYLAIAERRIANEGHNGHLGRNPSHKADGPGPSVELVRGVLGGEGCQGASLS